MTKMFSTRIAAFVIVLLAGLAPATLAQSTMIKGKVIDGNKEPMVGVAITIEFMGGVNRKLSTKTDKRGEFIQLLTEGGQYKVTAPIEDGSASGDRCALAGVRTFKRLVPTTDGQRPPQGGELKKACDEGRDRKPRGTTMRRFLSKNSERRWDGDGLLRLPLHIGVARWTRSEGAEADGTKALK